MSKKKIADLLKCPKNEKTNGIFRVAYQIPESGNAKCGRSFEEAFLLKNFNTVVDNIDVFQTLSHELAKYPTVGQIQTKAYEIAEKLSNKKTDFAFEIIMSGFENWDTPEYIKEGLLWLAN